MNYTLAKELKDAGFPQKNSPIIEHCVCDSEEYLGESKVHPADSCFVYLPTLEELIEACGKDFKSLEKDSVAPWYALGLMVRGQGQIPTEAVARLWLALNKK